MSGKLAVYAGSFDPPTIGHTWMIEQGAEIFDRLRVAVGVNPGKRSLFPLEARLEMLRDMCREFPNVEVDSFPHEFLIRYAQSAGARYVLRGIRSESDYEYERVMRNINGDWAPDVTTVFLMPPRAIAEVSSSMVKSLVGPKGWEEVVKSYVPAAVFERMLKVAP